MAVRHWFFVCGSLHVRKPQYFVIHQNIGSIESDGSDVALVCSSSSKTSCLPKNGILLIAETTKSLSEPRLGNLREVIKENGFEFNNEGCYDEYKFTFIEARKI